MKIAISGGTGFIGKNLVKHFQEKGYEITLLKRDCFREETPLSVLKEKLTDTQIVINLAGETINHRWTKSYKQKMFNSRVIVTRKLVQAINSLEQKPELFISVSAIGYYPTYSCYNDYSTQKGDGFLSDLCEYWENEAKQISQDIRLVIPRFGVVLDKNGGALNSLTLSTKFKITTVIGHGNQFFPCISLFDLITAIDHVIINTSLNGVVNFVIPNQITNRKIMETIGNKKKTYITISIPEKLIRIIFGEASSILIAGQCVIPQKLLDSGFSFKYPHIDKFIDALYNK